MRKLPWLATTIIASVVPALAFGAFARTGTPAVAFHASGPAGLKIDGKTAELDVSDADGKLKVSVPLANLDTGISLRNRHMREKYLEVAKYPRAELVVERSALKLPADGAEGAGDATGQMTIHGQTKSVPFHYSVKLTGGSYAVSGSTKINIKEFGIDVPSYLGVTVKPDVEIDVRFEAADR